MYKYEDEQPQMAAEPVVAYQVRNNNGFTHDEAVNTYELQSPLSELNPSQRHLLRAFRHIKSEDAQKRLKTILNAFLAEQIEDEVDYHREHGKLKDYTPEQIQNMHLRTPYRSAR